MLIDAATGGLIDAGAATLSFAPGSLPADAYVSVTTTDPTGLDGLTADSLAYDLKAVDVKTGALIEHFNSPPVLTVTGVTGGQIYYLSPTDGPQAIASTSDQATGTVSAGLPHFSTYVVASGTWTVTLDSTVASETLRVDNNLIDLVLPDGTIESAPLAGLTGVSISAAAGNALSISLAGGSLCAPGGACAPLAISFDGGGGGSLSFPGLGSSTSWAWDGTTLTGTSAGGDFGTITATGVSSLQLDPSYVNSLADPSAATAWTIDGTEAGSVAGLSFTGATQIASGSGTASGTLTVPTSVTTGSSEGTGSVLGVSYTGIATVNVAAVADFSYQAPAGQN
ncbi:MAG: hypothetical protein ACRDL8_16150, partial [Solirubrobacteraceae bacterium]